jgi:mRNA interferase MazF
MAKRYVPERGDVVQMDFDPQADHEQKGRRPALVLSPSEYNGKTSLALVCPISNQSKGYPFEEPIPKGLAVTGVILSDKAKNLDWHQRKATYLGTLPPEVVGGALGRLLSLLIPPEAAVGEGDDDGD